MKQREMVILRKIKSFMEPNVPITPMIMWTGTTIVYMDIKLVMDRKFLQLALKISKRDLRLTKQP
jgi:hypothetical protein